jgi:hypothetical protein
MQHSDDTVTPMVIAWDLTRIDDERLDPSDANSAVLHEGVWLQTVGFFHFGTGNCVLQHSATIGERTAGGLMTMDNQKLSNVTYSMETERGMTKVSFDAH